MPSHVQAENETNTIYQIIFNKIIDLVVQFLKLYHVIRSFARVPERHVLWHNSVEHHFHVVSHVRVPILVDGQAG